jgi:Bacterial regulatory proteins, lacI family
MTDRRPAPTIHDVARNVGVSTATVGRARSGRGTVRPHTRCGDRGGKDARLPSVGDPELGRAVEDAAL